MTFHSNLRIHFSILKKIWNKLSKINVSLALLNNIRVGNIKKHDLCDMVSGMG